MAPKKIFPPLYKKSSNGAILIWQLAVHGTTIITIHGQLGGTQQTSTDTITEGKNAGKKNATTPETQADLEAGARYTKQLKKRYVPMLEAARAGEVDTDMVQGGIPPMLSKNQSYPSDSILEDMPYPCLRQPKLDGACIIACVKDGVASLWSRTQKPKRSMPHIVKALEKILPGPGLTILHGEGYNHDYKDRFEDLIGIINSDEPDEAGLYKDIQFHVYDLPHSDAYGVTYETPYEKRYSCYHNMLATQAPNEPRKVIAVVGEWCENLTQLLAGYEKDLLAGYEGSMAIDPTSPYKAGRTWAKRKMKEFADGEMFILEVLDGRGKDKDVASKIRGEFTGPNGKKVIVEPSIKCSYEKKREYWENREFMKGKKATIKYKRLTADGVPYIPGVIWKAVRDYE